MDRAQKKNAVAELNEALSGDTKSVVILYYRGLTVAEMSDLRSKARENSVSIKVTKNTLTKRALEGTEFSGLAELFSGPTAIAFSNDEVAAAKTIVDFAKENEKVEIVAGALGNKTLELSEVKSLASLPSLDESRAKLIALINTPATKLAGVLQSATAQVPRVLAAKASAGE